MLAARQENVTTSLQPYNLRNRLHALCTSAMLQRYNLYSKKLYVKNSKGDASLKSGYLHLVES